ncbi:hypothetical protein E2C01_030638 [Portunus trituberculatus]|uniref:Uncharacterized protein n=1 Tax=Portunus trituberculatus TaxID=210409 RepID=A0A5B7EUR9_PORTR|nr:hypothetical protein [Portunus trituberculatus]
MIYKGCQAYHVRDYSGRPDRTPGSGRQLLPPPCCGRDSHSISVNMGSSHEWEFLVFTVSY